MNEEIKIIDLLNKIANNEEVPKKIRYDGNDYYFCNHCEIYEVIESSELGGKDLYNLLDNLNDKVEIIEEDNKIEKIPYKFSLGYIDCNIDDLAQEEINKTINGIYDKINELIDEVNKLKEE